MLLSLLLSTGGFNSWLTGYLRLHETTRGHQMWTPMLEYVSACPRSPAVGEEERENNTGNIPLPYKVKQCLVLRTIQEQSIK